MQILLIDDDADDQMLFCEAVQQISDDFTVTVCSNGQEGLNELYRAERLPEVVFLDINMPLMDGHEVMRTIRSNARFASLNVVIYTTSNSAVERNFFQSMGARFMTKPSHFSILVQQLSRELYLLKASSGKNQIV